MKNSIRISALILLICSIFSCKKEDVITAPYIKTTAVTSITYTSAIAGGNMTNTGGAFITAKGVCWSTTVEPTIVNDTTIESTEIGDFTSKLTELTPNTMYFIRAYATNSVGTTYGNEVLFKTSAVEVPVLITTELTAITQTTAVSGGNITDEKGGSVIERGICWGTTPTPVIQNGRTADGTGPGVFSSSITGLKPNTTYYARAYATNSMGTGYGPVVSFASKSFPILFNPNLTYGTSTDIDGNTYKTIIIGTQTWMAENLKTTKYNDGTAINYVAEGMPWLSTTPSYCWYNSDIAHKETYGALYNWYAVNTGKLCPTGWHVSTDAEWTALLSFLGGPGNAGNKLKETGRIHFSVEEDVTIATNESGFTALPGGCRNFGATFGYNGASCWWWTSTEYGPSNGYWRLVNGNDNFVSSDYEIKSYSFSVRCVKD